MNVDIRNARPLKAGIYILHHTFRWGFTAPCSNMRQFLHIVIAPANMEVLRHGSPRFRDRGVGRAGNVAVTRDARWTLYRQGEVE
jgi:hypothetical protein